MGPHLTADQYSSATTKLKCETAVKQAAGMTCKPRSVLAQGERRLSIWDDAHTPPPAVYPAFKRDGPPLMPYLTLLRVGFAWLRMSPSAPVRSYRTLSPSPDP